MGVDPTYEILEFVSTVVVPPTTAPFVAKENFILSIGHTRPKIDYLSENFTEWFLSDQGKIEGPISEQILYCYRLRNKSCSGQIISRLGGKAKAESTLSGMSYLMEKQGNCEFGVLLNDSHENISYIKDQNGVLRTVVVCRDGGGWHVYAYPVESPFWWSHRDRVFSPSAV